jgi:hypothetical protein
MRDDDVPAKTHEGLAEIKTRDLGLAPRMRTALLLVDGVKPVSELEQLLAASGVKPGALQTLLEKGLISIHQDDSVSVPGPETSAVTEAVFETTPAPEAVSITEAAPASETVPGPVAAATPEPSPASQAVRVPEPSAPLAATPAPQAAPAPKAATAPEPPAAPKPVSIAKPAAAPKTPTAPKPAPVTKAALDPVPAANAEPAPKAAPVAKAAPIPKPTAAAKAPSTPKAAPAPQGPARLASPSPVVTAVRLPEPAHRHERDEVREHEVQIVVAPPPPENLKLLIARAHVANALDDRVDSFVLRQMVASCSSRAELESLFDAAEKKLKISLGSARSAAVLGAAKALLHS